VVAPTATHGHARNERPDVGCLHTDGYLDSDKAGTNGAPRPRTGRNICEVCERALARTDTGMCDFCTVKQQRQAGGVA